MSTGFLEVNCRITFCLNLFVPKIIEKFSKIALFWRGRGFPPFFCFSRLLAPFSCKYGAVSRRSLRTGIFYSQEVLGKKSSYKDLSQNKKKQEKNKTLYACLVGFLSDKNRPTRRVFERFIRILSEFIRKCDIWAILYS